MDNTDIIETTIQIENEIGQLLNDLTHQQKIKHFVVGDDEVINEKEGEFLNEKDNYTKNLDNYFHVYDKFFEICESKFKSTLDITKSGITSIASVSLTSFKSLYIQMEQIIKNLSENELNVDYSHFLTNLVEKIDREMLDKKYTLRIINEK